MENEINILSREEELKLELRSIYESHGFKKANVNKFEPYDLYVDNKSFLNTDKIISFMDLDGRVLSLKPDVTLSIVKKMPDEKLKGFMKVYYDEKVVRLPFGSHEYKEISQTGIEILGEIDAYAKVEAVFLALRSLNAIGEPFVLDISHMGFVSGLLDECDTTDEEKKTLNSFIFSKNTHELESELKKLNIPENLKKSIETIPLLYGPFESTLERAKSLALGETSLNALKELENLYNSVKFNSLSKNISLDFSIVNDIDYYNGIIFQGYIKGLSKIVLKGGNYDFLTKKMGKQSGAIGFAVYTDELSRLLYEKKNFDCDIILLYDDKTEFSYIYKIARDLILEDNFSIRIEREIPDNITAAKILDLRENKDA
ncbi:MAG: ATP phosphoribosyltransferase regulatory subunit [Clostridiales bacterium]|nr:ATP phosphoribosyltransferase regulatory subunit [Clostridiales bacterium]